MPTSGQGLDRSQISDWVTGLSAGQPWPAEMGVAVGGSGAGIREVSGFDKGKEDSQVSESEPNSLSLSPSLCLLLPPIFLHNLLSNKNIKTDHSSFWEYNE